MPRGKVTRRSVHRQRVHRRCAIVAPASHPVGRVIRPVRSPQIRNPVIVMEYFPSRSLALRLSEKGQAGKPRASKVKIEPQRHRDTEKFKECVGLRSIELLTFSVSLSLCGSTNFSPNDLGSPGLESLAPKANVRSNLNRGRLPTPELEARESAPIAPTGNLLGIPSQQAVEAAAELEIVRDADVVVAIEIEVELVIRHTCE